MRVTRLPPIPVSSSILSRLPEIEVDPNSKEKEEFFLQKDPWETELQLINAHYGTIKQAKKADPILSLEEIKAQLQEHTGEDPLQFWYKDNQM